MPKKTPTAAPGAPGHSARLDAVIFKASAPRIQHLPERTCVACRGKAAKRQLVRIVRTPPGPVVVDSTGKQAGRGAYLHQDAKCWQLALSKGQLERSLKVKLSPQDRAHLLNYGAALGEGAPREDRP